MKKPFTYKMKPAPEIDPGVFADFPVTIVGGGVAGIAAAVRLAEYHVPVTLVETRIKLGGRATSFVDPKTGDVLDNCQHVLMGCCTNLIDLYKRLGVYEHVTWHPEIYFDNGTASPDVMRSGMLPAPLHLSVAFMRFKSLRLRDKFAIARASSAMIRTSFAKRNSMDHVSFLDWLRRHGQHESVIKKYWEPVIVSACNEELGRCSARYALQVFQEGFLHHKDAWLMGTSEVPLLNLYDPAEAYIKKAGGQLRLSSPIDSFTYDANEKKMKAVGFSRSDQPLQSAAMISAIPFDRLAKLSTEQMVADDTRLQKLDRFSVSPIIGVHVYAHLPSNESVTDLPHLVLTDSPIQWVFNKGMVEEDGKRMCHLHCVISAANHTVDMSPADLAKLAEDELRRHIPGANEATFCHTRAVKEKRATFSVTTGLDDARPDASPLAGQGIANLFLAGDWTDVGWPATMEGAARSGYKAAHGVLAYLLEQLPMSKRNDMAGKIPLREDFLVPDLPSSFLYSMLSKLPG